MPEHARAEPPSGLPRGFVPGSEVGGYRIGSRLGSGAMGAVYSAYDGGGALVAMKFLHAHLDTDARGRERLRREALALRRLRHPGVAQILDVELDGPEAFIVTELVPGPTLEEEIAQGGPLDSFDLYELADQLAAALEAVHAAGVVHRDLKPSNVLIAERGPVIIDFGIAHGLDDPRVTATGLVMGTPGYLPPELLDGVRPTPDTDWWGWAAVLAYAATGRAPFGVRPMDAVLARSRSGQPDLAGLGARTAAALAGALRADPEQRLGPTEVVDALRQAADDGDAPAPTIVVGPPTSETAVVPPILAPQVPVTQRSVHDGRTLAVPVDPPASVAPPPVFAPGSGSPAGGSPVFGPVGGSPAGGELSPDPAGPSPDSVAGPAPADVAAAAGESAYVRPVPPARTGVLLALAVPAVVLACLCPVIALGVYAIVVFGARIVGVAADALHTRRERRGVRPHEGIRSTVAMPWYALRALLGTLPSLLVGGCAGLLLVTCAWWALGPGGVDVPRSWVEPVILALAGVVAVALVWAGPLSYLTRYGMRTAVNALAPSRTGGLAVAALALALAAIVVGVLANGTPVTWWPLPGPPEF